MCETLLYHYENDPSILDNIWFSDEAVFHLSGRVNRHNTWICGTENPKVIEEKERDSPKLVVWCPISAKGTIGPYFFVMMPEETQLSQEKTIWKCSKSFSYQNWKIMLWLKTVTFSKMKLLHITPGKSEII